MPRAVVRRWGKNLAIRLPAEVATAARLGEGERVEIVVSDDAVVIRKLPTESSVVALFAGCSPETWRRSIAPRSIGGSIEGASASTNERTSGQSRTVGTQLEWQECAKSGH